MLSNISNKLIINFKKLAQKNISYIWFVKIYFKPIKIMINNI